RTVIAVLHDLDLVRAHFPQTLLLARRAVAWGPTERVLREENLAEARRFDEAWHDDAPWCETDGVPASGHDHADHEHLHDHADASGHSHVSVHAAKNTTERGP